MTIMIYDFAVIGKGLIGSAAAKYLAAQGSVIIVGPDEPKNSGHGVVYASHYDQARIQRITGTDDCWTTLNRRSAKKYRALQEATGIYFHREIGCLYVNPHGWDLYLERIKFLSPPGDKQHLLYNREQGWDNQFDAYQFPKGSVGFLEKELAGTINPRLLIEAQLQALTARNGKVLRSVAEKIIRSNEEWLIMTQGGNVVKARQALVAAGAFSNCFNLLPVKLDLTLKSEATIWAAVSEAESKRLEQLPALLYEIETPEVQNIYLVPPVEYPDGRHYIKMGANLSEDVFFTDLNGIQKWFQSPADESSLKKLEIHLHQLLPNVDLETVFPKKCIVTKTAHGKPYIGEIEKDLFVSTGGNGYSAMCSDALGELSAELMISGKFLAGLSQEDFVPIFSNKN